MTPKIENEMLEGMDRFCERIDKKKVLYKKLLLEANSDKSGSRTFRITNPALFTETLHTFGPMLDQEKAEKDLTTLYDIGIHKETGALLISNKGATLYCRSPKTETPYLARHIGIIAYIPGLGVEMVNIGLVGDVYDNQVVLRSESACSPSFLYGSQRCNCAHQWHTIQELAADFHTANPPEMEDGYNFEKWVQDQAEYVECKHRFKSNAKAPGFILMHVDTQNGMGSGFTDGEFAFDLYSRASMRHRGEYSSEQVHGTSMAGGFEAIGLEPDPRKLNDQIGYKLIFVILDYLEVSKDITFLTNNPLKMKHLKSNGYNLSRLRLFGEVNVAGALEAKERGTDFEHLDITEEHISFNSDFKWLRDTIKKQIV